jgi:hypothetical protein
MFWDIKTLKSFFVESSSLPKEFQAWVFTGEGGLGE